MYKLSLIIPIYRVEAYIEECLESVLLHLPNNVQVICINDGTPDNSMDIAKTKLSKYDDKIQNQFLFFNQENQGLSAARNSGINLAGGEYISFLDSDDKLSPNYFKIILSALKESKYDLIDFHLITSEDEIIKTNNGNFDSVFSLMNWFCPGRIFKKTLISKFQFTQGILYEDLDLTPSIYLSAESILHLNEPLYWYRSNDSGITRSLDHNNNLRTIRSLKSIFNKYYQLYISSDNPYYGIVCLQSFYLLCVSACRRFGLKQGIKYFRENANQLKAISINELPINLEDLNPKIKYFYKNPIIYLLTYSLYNNIRNYAVSFNTHK